MLAIISLYRSTTQLWLLFIVYCCMLSTPQAAQGIREKYGVLYEQFTQSAPIRTDGVMFESLIMEKPKNYTVVAMLTALGQQYRCEICHVCYQEFQLVAQGYQQAYLYEKPKLFFVLLDVDAGGQVFQKLKIRTVPHILEFEEGKTYFSGRYNFEKSGFEAENIASWVEQRTQVPKIKITRPVDYLTPVLIVLGTLAVVVAVVLTRNQLLSLFGQNFWGIVILGIIFTFTSGQMWNYIQSPPWTSEAYGKTVFISRGTEMQLYAETFIIVSLYASFTVGMILMNFATEAKLKRRFKILMSFGGLAAVIVFYSLLLSIFRTKEVDYPYRCLFA